jgi:hypothetical protein
LPLPSVHAQGLIRQLSTLRSRQRSHHRFVQNREFVYYVYMCFVIDILLLSNDVLPATQIAGLVSRAIIE